MIERQRAVVVDGDLVPAPRQRLGEADEGRLGTAHRRTLGQPAVEGDAVIRHDDVGHPLAACAHSSAAAGPAAAG